uniref:Uncharacterized protein n=1 Tax=Solanum lycopersicum TaxID=4081 RepID=A0A3Q7GVF6_SOLLC
MAALPDSVQRVAYVFHFQRSIYRNCQEIDTHLTIGSSFRRFLQNVIQGNVKVVFVETSLATIFTISTFIPYFLTQIIGQIVEPNHVPYF